MEGNKITRIDIKKIIQEEKIETVFQPIMNLKTEKIIGFEALVRCPKECKLEPEKLFKEAKRIGLTEKLDILCIKKAADKSENFSGLNFINILPSTIIRHANNGKSLEKLSKICPPEKTVFEITETEDVKSEVKILYHAVKEMKKLGYRIAIDDIASGYNRLQLLVELNPDFIKIDRIFISNCKKNLYKKAISFLKKLADDFGAKTIAEGIETKTEFKTVKNLGIAYAQGYFLGTPVKEIKNFKEEFNNGRRFQTGT